MFACAHSIDPLSWSEVQDGENEAGKFKLPAGTGEAAHLGTKEKEGCHVPRDELKEERRPKPAGYSFPP